MPRTKFSRKFDSFEPKKEALKSSFVSEIEVVTMISWHLRDSREKNFLRTQPPLVSRNSVRLIEKSQKMTEKHIKSEKKIEH